MAGAHIGETPLAGLLNLVLQFPKVLSGHQLDEGIGWHGCGNATVFFEGNSGSAGLWAYRKVCIVLEPGNKADDSFVVDC